MTFRPTRAPAHFLAALIGGFILTGCASPPRPAPAAPPPTTTTPEPAHAPEPPPAAAPAPQPPARIIDPAAAPVVKNLARLLRIDESTIEVLAVRATEWPDACLGIPADGEICASMMTPGNEVSLVIAGERYVVRTAGDGTHWRIADCPPPEPGEPLLTWRDSDSFSTLVVGTQRVSFGRRGRPQLTAPLAVPERAIELQQFLQRFAPFQASTPAGLVALRGVGTLQPSALEQRQLAEWARIVANESREGALEPMRDRSIIWRRTGGIAGFCDTVAVSRSGVATAYSCRGGAETEVAHIDLNAEDLALLYGWLDRYEKFAWNSADPAIADAMHVHFELAGAGIDDVPAPVREDMLAWCNSVVRRLMGRTP